MKNTFTIFLLLACGICFGQNLVPNGSFEEMTRCPTNIDHIDSAIGWGRYCITPNYFNRCADSPAHCSVPWNGFGYQEPSTGNAYGGFFIRVGQNEREVLGCPLIAPLTIGVRYFVKFKITLAEGGIFLLQRAYNKIGARFSTVSYVYNSNPTPINNFAHVYSDSIITDTINWVTIQGSFVADSAYQYLALGCFFDDAHINSAQMVPFGTSGYYYIDDVCVSTDSLPCDFAVGVQEPKQNTDVSFSPNPFSTQLTFTLPHNEPTTVTLYNFLGQQVLQKSFTNTTTLNTEQMQHGIYFYELHNTNGVVRNGKILKQ